MKLKHLLLLAGVALFVPDASAYYKTSKDMQDRTGKISVEETTERLHYLESASNPIYHKDNNASALWRCRYYTDLTQFVYLTKDDNGNMISNFVNTNSNSGGSNLAMGKFTKDANGHWVCTAPNAAAYRFRIEFPTAGRPNGRSLAGLTVKAVLSDMDGVTAMAYVSPSKYDCDDGAGSAYHWTVFDLVEVGETDGVLSFETQNMRGETEGLYVNYIKAIDIVFYGVKKSTVLGVVGLEGLFDSRHDVEAGDEFDPSQFFVVPSINSGSNTTPNYSTFPGDEVEHYMVYHMQAEDFDEPWVNGRVAHSPVYGTIPDDGKWRRYEEDMNVGSQSHGGCFTHFGATYPGDNMWTDDWGPRMPGRFYQNPQNGVVANMHQHADWGAYEGEYLDEESNKVSFEQAADNFGAWLEYTFDAEEDMNLDMSFRTACHWLPFTTIKTNGSSAEGKSREEGGFVVDGLEGGYLQQYSHALRVFIDGQPIRTNWDVYPKYVPGMTEAEFAELAKTPQNWTNYQEEDENGVKRNSYILHLFPWAENVNSWDPYEKWQLIKKFAADPNVPAAKVAARVGEAPTSYIRPDFADIPVAQGRHTIKVQSLGGQWMFDDMKLVGKPKNWSTTGIDAVGNDADELFDADAPVEIYNLQGVRLPSGAQLAPGIYVKRQGQQVVKFVVR